MTVVRLALSELRRLTSGTLPRLAVVAIALIPTLYAGLYLFANHDPYANLDEVPAALVVQDTGTTSTDPTTGEQTQVTFGRDVADQLLEDGGFSWTETTQDDAERGVRSGRWSAVLIIGPDFSADLASISELEPHQASLRLITNDANNYLAHTIATQIVGQVRDAIAAQVGEEAADTFLGAFATIREGLVDARDGAEQLLDGSQELRDGLVTADDGAQQLADGTTTLADGTAALRAGAGDLADGVDQLASGAGSLSSGLDQLRTGTADLPSQTATLADGAQQVADGDARLAAAADDAVSAAQDVLPALDTAREDVGTALDEELGVLVEDGLLTQEQADDLRTAALEQVTPVLDAGRSDVQDALTQATDARDQIDALADGAQQVADGARRLADATPQLSAGIAQAADGADQLAAGTATLDAQVPTLVDGVAALDDGAVALRDGAGRLAEGTPQLVDGGGQLVDGLTELGDGLTDGVEQIPDVDADQRAAVAEAVGDPVGVVDDELSSAGTYGAGLAPFFLSLATWIGAYVLFLLVRPLSSRALAAGRPGVAAALGGWATPAAIGVLQVASMFAVTRFALDIEPAYPLTTGLFLVLVTATFVAILQALNAWLGTAGQFLGLVLMLLQLVTAGGTFPWQTIPQPLKALHQFLPMTYAVEGLRQLLYGGSLVTVTRDVTVLAAVLVGALATTTLAARHQRVWDLKRLQPELVL